MPKIRKVESLLGKCLLTVASHVANYNSNIQLEATLANDVELQDENSVSKCVVNPFDTWPPQLVKKIIDTLRANGWLNIRHRDLLITAHSRELDLSSVSGFIDAKTAPLFLQHAGHITDLSMGWDVDNPIVDQPPEFYKEYLPRLKHLRVLDVSNSQEGFDDSCLHILGTYCPNLRELNIRYCNITDDGIEGLCGGPTSDHGEDMPIGQRKSGQCKLIEKLLVGNTKVTPKGVQMALRHLLHLKIFDSRYVVQALADMHQNDLTRPKYGLTQLTVSLAWMLSWDDAHLLHLDPAAPVYVPYRNGALGLAVSMCLSVTRLDIISGEEITDDDLLGLTVLENLNDFRISGYGNYCNFTFEGGLAPLLKARGRSLKTLKLRSLLNTVYLVSVIEDCPNLEHLHLIQCHFSAFNTGLEEESSRSIKRIKTDLVLKNLKRLELDCNDHSKIHSESLLLVLSASSTVSHLSISSDDLDDVVLQQTFQLHSFSNLEMLILKRCPLITKIGIDLFMNEENNLKELVILNCRAGSKENIVNLKEMAKKLNWDLKIVDNYFDWLRPNQPVRVRVRVRVKLN